MILFQFGPPPTMRLAATARHPAAVIVLLPLPMLLVDLLNVVRPSVT